MREWLTEDKIDFKSIDTQTKDNDLADQLTQLIVAQRSYEANINELHNQIKAIIKRKQNGTELIQAVLANDTVAVQNKLSDLKHQDYQKFIKAALIITKNHPELDSQIKLNLEKSLADIYETKSR